MNSSPNSTASPRYSPDEIRAEMAMILAEMERRACPKNRFSLYANEPEAFLREVLGVQYLTPDQCAALASIAANRNTAIPSGHGNGKDWLLSRVALWRTYCSPHGASKVIATANTEAQLKRVFWGEVQSAWHAARVRLPGQMTNLALVIGPQQYLIGLTARDATAMQGHHAAWVTVIYDEADGIAPEFFTAGQSLAVGPEDKQIAIFNPVDPTSEMCRRQSSGQWAIYRMNSENHPNVVSGRQIVPGAVTQAYISEIFEEAGSKDTALYRSRVLGLYPEQGDDVLIPLSVAEKAQERWKKFERTPDALGVDVARFGSDETVLIPFFTENLVRHPGMPVARKGQDTMGTAGQAKSFSSYLVGVDDCGVGGGVTDRLAELGEPVVAVNAGEKADDEAKFVNRRSEMWWAARLALMSGDLSLPPDPRLIGDLTGIKYGFDSRGRIKVESKDEVKKRLKRSPDRGDALVIANWVATRHTGYFESGAY